MVCSIKRKIIKRILLPIIITIAVLILIVFANYILQRFWAHRDAQFKPDYDRVEISEQSDWETIFLQTGLGRSATQKLIRKNKFDKVLKAQDNFFADHEVECTPLLGWFTREDVLKGEKSTAFADLQKGDIILTLSTHSIGWKHGHAALVVGKNKVLECRMMGTDSVVATTSYWRKYSNYAVLRIKDITKEQQKQIVEYSREELEGIPYSPITGVFGDKKQSEREEITLQCAYLIWYAWNNFGIDLDSDAGKIVTVRDLLDSDMLEVVQIFGMDPREFLD